MFHTMKTRQDISMLPAWTPFHAESATVVLFFAYFAQCTYRFCGFISKHIVFRCDIQELSREIDK
jgi:hypothetical protein